MTESIRELLYPLGFLASLTFGGRFLLQWINSEREQKSVVTPLFWKLSLIGNCLLWVHSLIQLQFHVACVQSCNAVISWRNLTLMQRQESAVRIRRGSKRGVVGLFIGSLSLTSLFFYLASPHFAWFRIPSSQWFGPATEEVHFFWHCLGFTGLALFSSRFWVQWWLAEKNQVSSLGSHFWWLSLSGDLMTLAYFIQIYDPVNMIGPILGLIPYIRNLMLIRQSSRTPLKPV